MKTRLSQKKNENMQKIIILFFLSFIAISNYAQQDLGTPFLSGTWQSTLINPALLPDHKITVALPGFYNNLVVTNVTFDDLVVTDQNGPVPVMLSA